MILPVLAITEGGIGIAAAITGGARADAARHMLALAAKGHAEAQVDPAIARIAAAVAARPIE
ncbi:hypothetical protein D9M71_787030 [compost metagenome]